MRTTVSTVEAAWQLFAAGHFADASDIAHNALLHDPDNAAALTCAAVADWEMGRDITASLAMIQRATRLAPDNAAVWHNLATLHASRGDIDGACAGFEQALRINPEDTRAFFGLAQNRRFTEETPLVQHMLQLYGSGLLDRAALEFLCFGLAKVYADLGNPSRAIHFCIEANWLAHRPFDMEAERRRLASIRDLAASGTFARGRNSIPGPAPIFIVGMPRSGTTLVEAILARHPSVHVLGETNRMADLDRTLTGDDPAGLAAVPRDRRRAAAEAALREMRAGAAPDTRYVADKTPDNAFRIATIAALFPQARIIHMRRHPLDCGLSNLFTRFTSGQGFSFRQPDLGERIRQTAEVMTIWKEADLLPILDVSYERLVAEPEAQARRLIDFLDLPWNDACLAPEQARHHVRTASQFQVRQKVNNRSVGRHAQYREWLAPLVEALGGDTWIEAEYADQHHSDTIPANHDNPTRRSA